MMPIPVPGARPRPHRLCRRPSELRTGASPVARFRATPFLPVSLGLIIVPAVVLFYMIVHFGVRRTFESFDVIRRFSRSNRSAS